MPDDLLEANLTLTGWGQYESEKRGKIEGRYGFIAMQFGVTCSPTCPRS
jgi:hypothetical protein